MTKRISNYNFVIPNYRLPNKGVQFDHFLFLCEDAPRQYKNQIVPPRNKVGYNVQNMSYTKDFLVLNEGKEIKKIYFDPTERLNLLQESCFVYDRSSLVKPTFITEINKFLPIYCSASNVLEEKQNKSKIISPANQTIFTIEKTSEKSKLNLQIAEVSKKKN